MVEGNSRVIDNFARQIDSHSRPPAVGLNSMALDINANPPPPAQAQVKEEPDTLAPAAPVHVRPAEQIPLPAPPEKPKMIATKVHVGPVQSQAQPVIKIELGTAPKIEPISISIGPIQTIQPQQHHPHHQEEEKKAPVIEQRPSQGPVTTPALPKPPVLTQQV